MNWPFPAATCGCEKAPDLGADIVTLDLKDAVAPDDKEQARINIIDVLRELDWSACSVSLRINGLDTHYCYRDLVDVVEQAGRHLDSIMIPKAGSGADIHLDPDRHFTDPAGFLASAHRAAVLGYEGKWAIHPSQIELANEVFTPSERIVEDTRRIVAAMGEAAADGKGPSRSTAA